VDSGFPCNRPPNTAPGSQPHTLQELEILDKSIHRRKPSRLPLSRPRSDSQRSSPCSGEIIGILVANDSLRRNNPVLPLVGKLRGL
jgi:hypothetical protein